MLGLFSNNFLLVVLVVIALHHNHQFEQINWSLSNNLRYVGTMKFIINIFWYFDFFPLARSKSDLLMNWDNIKSFTPHKHIAITRTFLSFVFVFLSHLYMYIYIIYMYVYFNWVCQNDISLNFIWTWNVDTSQRKIVFFYTNSEARKKNQKEYTVKTQIIGIFYSYALETLKKNTN